MKKTVICLTCGKLFIIDRKRRLKTAKFCSIECKNKYGKVILECSFCGSEFEREKFRLSEYNGKNKFCSIKCRNSFNKQYGSWNKGINLVEVSCDWCGKKFIKALSILKQYKNHFCSEKCYQKWQSKNRIGPTNYSWKSIELLCDFCGEKMFIQPNRKEHREHHFCSRKCFGKWNSENIIGENHPSWKGGFEESRGPNWLKQRKKALERNKYMCQNCGSFNDLDVHHIVPFSIFGLKRYEEANKLENLISYCHSCHMKIEPNLIKIKKIKNDLHAHARS